MAVLLGILVAASFGSGDFLGGRASRRAPTLTVLMVAQAAAVAGAVAVCIFVSGRVTERDIMFGALAGTVNIVGIGLLYHGLAIGRMSVVAPLCAVVASTVPVTWGIANGERPSAVVVIGIVFAVSAGALISRDSGEQDKAATQTSGLAWSLGAGACLGASLVLYVQTSTESGLWPVLAARTAAFILVALVLLVVATRRDALKFPSGSDRTMSVGAGALDVIAATLLLLAVRHGLITVVAPVAALAPAFTVVLARIVFRERMHSIQRVGLLFALLALAMIVAG